MPVHEIVEVEDDQGCVELRCGELQVYGYTLDDALDELREARQARARQGAYGFASRLQKAQPRVLGGAER